MQLTRFLGNFARTYLALGALSVSAFAGADEFYQDHHFGGNYGACCPQECQPECCPQPCAPQPCCEAAPTCNWGYNPPAYQHCSTNPCGGFMDSLRFRADFLWWRASVDNMEFGTEIALDTTSASAGTALFERARVKKPNQKFDPGFRIGLATICPDGCWDAAIVWTHFHTVAHARGASIPETSAGYAVDFYPAYSSIGDLPATFAKGRWTLDMDLIDLELAHKYYVTKCLVMRPSLGLRCARIDQGFRAFTTGSFTEDGTINFLSDVHAKNNFLGVGPRIGIDLEFDFGFGLSLWGQAAGSVLFGTFDRHFREDYTATGTDSVTTLVGDGKQSADRASRAVTDLAIGLKWDHCFCWCNHYHPVSFIVAWEHHAFYNFNNFAFNSDSISTSGELTGIGSRGRQGDLYTQGLTISACIGF